MCWRMVNWWTHLSTWIITRTGEWLHLYTYCWMCFLADEAMRFTFPQFFFFFSLSDVCFVCHTSYKEKTALSRWEGRQLNWQAVGETPRSTQVAHCTINVIAIKLILKQLIASDTEKVTVIKDAVNWANCFVLMFAYTWMKIIDKLISLELSFVQMDLYAAMSL